MPEISVTSAVRIAHLTDSNGILTELRSLYRDARRGVLEPSEATKLAYLLKIMSEIMSLRDMEARLDALEAGRPYTPRRISA
jgi:hypothetical protein